MKELKKIARKPNTTKEGNEWTEATISTMWHQAEKTGNRNPFIWRRDKCGAYIKLDEFGNRQSEYGWEIDHKTAVANGGGDELSNLQPLNWKNNNTKSDIVNWSCRDCKMNCVKLNS